MKDMKIEQIKNTMIKPDGVKKLLKILGYELEDL